MANQEMLLKAMTGLRARDSMLMKAPTSVAIREGLKFRPVIPAAPAPPAPAPAPPPVAAAPAPVLPAAPPTNPFELLPMPSAGDRIKAEDFRALSQALRLVYDAGVMSAGLFGHTFADAKLLLFAQNYEIERVMTVLGGDIGVLDDTSLDDRRVVHVAPTALGERGVMVVLTEAVDQRRYAPDLTQAPTFRDAVALLRDRMGPPPASAPPVPAPNLTGLTLADLTPPNV
jgi:hypothetical protein